MSASAPHPVDRNDTRPDAERRLLQRRARELARPPEPQEPAANLVAVVEFRLGAEAYAIDVQYVAEVLPFRPLTRIPGVPAFVRGIVNVRGLVVAILDLRILLGLPVEDPSPQARILLLGSPTVAFGILADQVPGTGSLLLRELQPPLPTLRGMRAAFTRGVTSSGLALLDAPALLDDPRLRVCDTTEEHTYAPALPAPDHTAN